MYATQTTHKQIERDAINKYLKTRVGMNLQAYFTDIIRQDDQHIRLEWSENFIKSSNPTKDAQMYFNL